MSRGGKRPNSGRNAIIGKEIKIKVPDTICEQIELYFTGKTL